MHLITLVTMNSLFIFSLIWIALFLAVAIIVLVIPTAPLVSNDNYLFMVTVASNKAVESLLIDTVAAVTVTSSTNVDSIIVIVKTVIFATNSLCWIYTSEIIALLLMYNFFMHPGMYQCLYVFMCVCTCVCVYIEWEVDLSRTLHATAYHRIVLTDSLTVLCSDGH